MLALKKASERQEQEAVIQWINKQYPWLRDHTILIHNEKKCSLFVGKQLNAQGRLKGASDLFIAYPTNERCGLFLEMKTKTGRLTKEQKQFLERMNKVGYLALKANGAEEAIKIIQDYLKKQHTSPKYSPYFS